MGFHFKRRQSRTSWLEKLFDIVDTNALRAVSRHHFTLDSSPQSVVTIWSATFRSAKLKINFKPNFDRYIILYYNMDIYYKMCYVSIQEDVLNKLERTFIIHFRGVSFVV